MKTMEQSKKTRNLLIMHYQEYPQLKIQDVLKFLYQSSFGCEHLVSSLEMVTEYISKEYAAVNHEGKQSIDQLDGDYSRVPLSYLNQGLSVKTFGKLFVASAKQEKNGLADLIQKIKIARTLVYEGVLPFSQNEFEDYIAKWEAKGYPAVHHSDIFRETYRPSYRVIANRYVTFLPLFAEIDKQIESGKGIITVECGSASEKTAFSKMLEDFYNHTIFDHLSFR